jgi:peroxiredoxin family protein
MANEPVKTQAVSIIVSRGSLDGVYPGLILAQGARLEGIDVNLFFTSFGIHAVLKRSMNRLKVATVGNPAVRRSGGKGSPLPTWIGALPGISGLATRKLKRAIDKVGLPPIPELLEMIHDAGGRLYACKTTLDMFNLRPDDLCPQINRALTVGEFYQVSAGAQILFT